MVTTAQALVPNLKRLALVGDPWEHQTVRRHYQEVIPVIATQFEFIDLIGLPMSRDLKTGGGAAGRHGDHIDASFRSALGELLSACGYGVALYSWPSNSCRRCRAGIPAVFCWMCRWPA